eukprot:RCo053820
MGGLVPLSWGAGFQAAVPEVHLFLFVCSVVLGTAVFLPPPLLPSPLFPFGRDLLCGSRAQWLVHAGAWGRDGKRCSLPNSLPLCFLNSLCFLPNTEQKVFPVVEGRESKKEKLSFERGIVFLSLSAMLPSGMLRLFCVPWAWEQQLRFAEGPEACPPQFAIADPQTRRELTYSGNWEIRSARVDALLCVGQPGPTTMCFEVLNNVGPGLSLGVAPVSTCGNLRERADILPGQGSWSPGLCLSFCNGAAYYNGTATGMAVEVSPGDRVEVRLDRSDPSDPMGGTVAFAVNG